jgi:hypothetical protein
MNVKRGSSKVHAAEHMPRWVAFMSTTAVGQIAVIKTCDSGGIGAQWLLVRKVTEKSVGSRTRALQVFGVASPLDMIVATLKLL